MMKEMDAAITKVMVRKYNTWLFNIRLSDMAIYLVQVNDIQQGQTDIIYTDQNKSQYPKK